VRPLGIAAESRASGGRLADGSIWVQQRSAGQGQQPGMWDTLMGGMVSAADGLAEALARETWRRPVCMWQNWASFGTAET
jgi:8-oxo-dGTP pyrophosphatase MutT (NUDIX family)